MYVIDRKFYIDLNSEPILRVRASEPREISFALMF